MAPAAVGATRKRGPPGIDADRIGPETGGAIAHTTPALIAIERSTYFDLADINIQMADGSEHVDVNADLLSACINGDDNDNTIFGTSLADSICGLGGNDSLIGLGGNDTIFGGNGNDAISGSDGADWLLGEAGIDNLFGGSGNDVLEGGTFTDAVYGGVGNDTIRVRAGEFYDNVFGGDGNDTLDHLGSTYSGVTFDFKLGQITGGGITGISAQLVSIELYFDGSGFNTIVSDGGGNTYFGGGGDDYVISELGGETMYGGAGTDTIDHSRFVGNYNFDMATGTTQFANELYQTFERAIMGAGNDSVSGTTGPDTINGGAGNDRLFGGDGGDILIGGLGDDTLFGGGAGTNLLVGGGGTNTMIGGIALDTFWLASADGPFGQISIDGGFGTDTIEFLTGGTYDLTGLKVQGVERLHFGSNTTTSVTLSTAALNAATGLGSAHLVDFGNGPVYVVVLIDLAHTTADLAALSFGLWNINSTFSVVGSTSADTITGTVFGDVLFGGAGKDFISGGGGFDTLIGGDGIDFLGGGAGNDLIDVVETGANAIDAVIDGGDGFDTVSYAAAVSGVTVDLSNNANNTGAAAGETYTSIEGVIGSAAGGNTLTGDAGNNALTGGDGLTADALFGGAGNDTLYGGGGNDALIGGSGADTFFGGAGVNDLMITGDDGAVDSFDGGAGIADVVSYFSSGTGVTVNLANQAANTGAAAGETFTGVEGIRGAGAAANTLIGDAGGNVLVGGSAADSISSGAGSDIVYGGAGNDVINAGDNVDIIRGDQGNDTLTGGGGGDIFKMKGVDGNDTITDFAVLSDKVEFQVAGVSGFGNLVFQDLGGGNSKVTAGTVSVTFLGVALTDIQQAGNFDFI